MTAIHDATHHEYLELSGLRDTRVVVTHYFRSDHDWHVPDIYAKLLPEMTAAGAIVKEHAHDVGGGRLVATVSYPDGNVLGLLQDR